MDFSSRRDFLRAAVGAGLTSSILPKELLAQDADRPMPQRTLGKTGLKVSIIGLGGWDFASRLPEKEALGLVHRAMDLGINFFDNAWSYNDGRSEEWLGKALKGGRREKVFVMTKSEQRGKDDATRELEQSLKRLQTDYLDLWQFHSLPNVEEVDEIWAPGGAMEAAQAALKAGKVRHLGLTGHKDPACQVRALDHEGIETFQMPINPLDAHHKSFQEQVIAKARKKNVGIIAMKTLAKGKILTNKICTVEECLRYVWSLDVDIIVSGCPTLEILENNVKLAKAFTPMTEEERTKLLERVKPSAGIAVEYYKK